MTRLGRAVSFPLLAIMFGCRPASDAGAGATEEEQPRRITAWSDLTELYLESPPLVVGQPSKLAVHLTVLSSFRPLETGQVTIRFRSTTGSRFDATADKPSSPGIFGPAVTPSAAGDYQVDLLVHSTGLTDSMRLPTFTVYDPADDIPVGQPPPAAIAFLKEQQWKTPDFRTEFAVAGVLAPGVEASGTILAAPNREAIVSAPVAGILEAAGLSRAPIVGQRVVAGQVLATLTPTLPDGGSGVGTARGRLKEAEHEYDRARRLVAAEAAPARRLEEAAIALDAARAEVASLGGGGDGRVDLATPIGGVIADRRAVVGAHVSAGTALFTVVDPSVVWLEARVPGHRAAELASDLRASFRVDGDDRIWASGRPVAISPVVDSATRSVVARFEVANPRGSFRLGSSATVWIERGAGERGALIPATAIVEEDGRPVGYVQIEGERFERRDLDVGARRGDRVLVRRGIVAGERVVVGAAYQVRLASLSTAVPAHGHEH